MVAPTIQLADVLSRHQEQVYYYYFRHPLSYHSIELSYLFGTPFGADPGDESGKVSYATSTDGDRKMSLYLMLQWRAIARDGFQILLYFVIVLNLINYKIIIQ